MRTYMGERVLLERTVRTENDPYENLGTECTKEEDKTRQSEAQSADINFIVKKYEVTGVLPIEKREGVFADISEVPSFQEALAQLGRAKEYFMSLPPDVREAFGGEPAKMLDAWGRGEMAEVFERIGLLERVPAEAPAAGAAAPPA